MANKAQYAKKWINGRKVTLEGKRVFVWPRVGDEPHRKTIKTRAGFSLPMHLVKRHHLTREAALQDFEDVCNALLLDALPVSVDYRKEVGDDGQDQV